MKNFFTVSDPVECNDVQQSVRDDQTIRDDSHLFETYEAPISESMQLYEIPNTCIYTHIFICIGKQSMDANEGMYN